MKHDLIVVGGGPGGYVAAIRAAQLGKQVAIVERHARMGGTCTNVGCIPSKALLDSSEHYHSANKGFKAHGIRTEGLGVDWPVMRGRKDKVVELTAKGIGQLMEKNGIAVYHGHGELLSATSVRVKGETEQILEAAEILLATGSKPFDLPFCKIDKQRIISSTEALQLPDIPQTMTVIGAGVIGLELGSVYARLGTRVTVFEALDRALPTMDADLGRELERSLKKLGMKFHLGARVSAVTATSDGTLLKATDAKGRPLEVEAEYCLVAIGRKPYTEGLGLEQAGLKTDERGFLAVDGQFRTAVPNISAIGDVIGGAMLAHKAEEEGVFVAELLAGQKPHINHNLIPGVVYTWPEVASVGATEEQLKESGRSYRSGKFPFIALGRARAAAEKEGFVKMLADAETDELLGVHIFGARAADLIMEAVTAMEFKASAEDLARICHPHPTYSEGMKEAALAATGDRALHL